MTRKIKFLVSIMFFIFLISISLAFSIEQNPAPTPPGITIVPPDPSLPVETKLLSGKWTGRWDSFLGWDCFLYVEKVDRETARIVHSWGEYRTSRMSCHCSPNWARVQKAQVTYHDGSATIKFYTPGYETGHFKKKRHILSGEDEGWTSSNPKSHGHYTFSFTVEKSESDLMTGHFISGKGSNLLIKMKRIE